MINNIDKPKPFLKWAGGKRWFVDSYSHLIPAKFNNYYEPFLGAGSIFFYLTPKAAQLSDINPELINTYSALKEDHVKVKRRLCFHNRMHSTEHYYKIRAATKGGQFSKAGDFIYLNRTCWNGLYRVNRKGKFNVPIGDRASILREDDCFNLISSALSNSELKVACFSKALKSVSNGDFCFIDPPYTVKHDYNGFVRYNEKLFSWESQVELRDIVVSIKDSGGMALVLNANHSSIQELYKGVGKIVSLSRNSMLAAKPQYRGDTKEIAILVGYDPINGGQLG